MGSPKCVKSTRPGSFRAAYSTHPSSLLPSHFDHDLLNKALCRNIMWRWTNIKPTLGHAIRAGESLGGSLISVQQSPSQVAYSERTRELGREQALTATGVGRERPKFDTVRSNFSWSVIMFMGNDILSMGADILFLVYSEVKVQRLAHTQRTNSVVYDLIIYLLYMTFIIAHVSLPATCECLHHLESRKIPCENTALTGLCQTKLTDSWFSLVKQHRPT